MSDIALLPEDRRILAMALNGVIAARIKTSGRLDRNGLALSGTLTFLCNCGLLKYLGRLQQRAQDNAFLFYSLTDEGRAYLGETDGPPQSEPAPARSGEYRKEGDAGLAQSPLGA